MLSIRIADLVCTLACEQVQQIDDVDTVTALPFSHPPLEGLTHFNNQAVLQIDLANALGVAQNTQKSSKRVVINTNHGLFALRVDEVLNVSKTKTAHHQTPTTPLILGDILPNVLKKRQNPFAKLKAVQSIPPLQRSQISVLLVSSANKTLALFSEQIDHIQEITAFHGLNQQNSAGALLLNVREQMLSTYSLAQLLEQPESENCETIAVIIRNASANWALRVQKVLALKKISQIYTSEMDAQGVSYMSHSAKAVDLIDTNQAIKNSFLTKKSRLWYVTETAEIQEIIDPEQLRSVHHQPLNIHVATSAQPQATMLPEKKALTAQGLRIYCASSSYLLPLAMANRTLQTIDSKKLSATRCCASSRPQAALQIPYLNAATFLFSVSNQTPANTILLTSNHNQPCLLGVEHITLAHTLLASGWVAVDLPPPCGLFFDAAYYDQAAKQWILRVVDRLKFSDFPWQLKKRFVKAIIGWVDAAEINQIP